MKITRLVRARNTRRGARKAARAGNWHAAVQAYRDLVTRGVATSRDMVQMAHGLKEAGEIAAAAEAYREAAAAFPHSIDAQLHHGLFLQRLHRNREATIVLARVLAMDPANGFVRTKLKELGIGEDGMDAAMQAGVMGGYEAAARPAAAIMARPILGWHLRRARRFARARRWDAAARHYRRMLALDPHDRRVLVQLGHMLREQGDAAQAALIYRNALIIGPRHPETWLYLGHALKAQNRRTAALQAYTAAARLQPDFPPAIAELREMGWAEADLVMLGRQTPDTPETGNGPPVPAQPRLVMPDGLTRRERSIWTLLADHVENGN